MLYIHGLVFSSRTVEASPELRDQLPLLCWGGLHVALLQKDEAPPGGSGPVLDQATTATTAVGASSSTGSRSQPDGCVETLQFCAAAGGVSAAADLVAHWAQRRGLRWPEEVLLLGPAGDEAGQLRSWLLGQLRGRPGSSPAGRPGARSDGAAGAGVGTAASGLQGDLTAAEAAWGLAGLGSEAEGKQVPSWSRLRLALAHENLRRATATATTTAAVTATGRLEPAAEECKEDLGGVPAGGAGGGRPPQEPQPQLVVVGFAMKASRERDLSREGLINLVPQDGVVFAPLDLSQPLEQQLPFHAVLHKASDELESGPDGAPRFGPRVRALAAFAAAHPGVSLVDPLDAAAKVIDRTVLARVCESLARVDLDLDLDHDPDSAGGQVRQPCRGAAATEAGSAGDGRLAAADGDAFSVDGESESGREQKRRRVGPRVSARAPRSATLSSFEAAEVEAALRQLDRPPPYIVKPVVACGTPDSHQMALVLTAGALAQGGLQLPLPAVVQEFVNHGATIYKVYVAGEKVFHTVRPSIPDVPTSPAEVLRIAPSGFLTFDSLKSLPTSLEPPAANSGKDTGQPAAASSPIATAAATAALSAARAPPQDALERLAAHLREQLGLSLFGFDVVVAARAAAAAAASEGCGAGEGAREVESEVVELVVIDVNYFPSYRGAAGAPALFRAAVRQSHERQQRLRQQGNKAGQQQQQLEQ